MVDRKISQFNDGGLVQTTDIIAAVRSGANTKVIVGSMAAQDAADYTETDDLGTAAFYDVGTSGATVPLCNSANTWAEAQVFSEKASTAASSTTRAGLNIAPGSAPTTPTDGDVWTTSGGVFARVNGVTKQLDGTISSQAFIPNGRLTLTTGVPITITDVTAANTIYYTPYKGNQIALYDGSAWSLYTFTERSLALSGLTSGRPHDVFLYNNSGTLTLELTAWTNDTTRATALVLQDGVLVRSGATTRRYLGTFYTTGTTTTEDSVSNRYLFNYYNRAPRKLRRIESTGNWSYNSASWRQARADSANRVGFMNGVQEDTIDVEVYTLASVGSGAPSCAVGIGIDSTSTNSADVFGGYASTVGVAIKCHYRSVPPLGQMDINWLEYGNAANAVNFIGTITSANCGINGTVLA